MTQNVTILDCTLRDGSYRINHQFTAEDTSKICAALEEAGLRMIEVGHGVGLGASGPEYGYAAATDEEYLQAAASSLKAAEFGAFFIPGIGTKDHLDMARAHGMGFLRIGANITQSEETKDYIIYAKKLGFSVSYNAMKSYVVTPKEFLNRVKKTVEWGADAVFLVDSAGGMVPKEVQEYTRLMKDNLNVDIGFHGHNNFMLANANSLAAYESGAVYLDATIQGIGRSSGNAHTEALIILLEKMGVQTGIDLWKSMQIGDTFIRPLMDGGGISSMEIVTALSLFHSSYLPRIQRVVQKIPVDPKVLVYEVSKIDKVNPSEELMEKVAFSILKSRSGEGL